MSEYIDREATVKKICKIAHELCGHDENVLISIALFIQDDKKSFPTVEIPHGEWEETNDGDEIYGRLEKCSECGALVLSTHMNYCGNCGAKMEEGEAE